MKSTLTRWRNIDVSKHRAVNNENYQIFVKNKAPENKTRQWFSTSEYRLILTVFNPTILPLNQTITTFGNCSVGEFVTCTSIPSFNFWGQSKVVTQWYQSLRQSFFIFCGFFCEYELDCFLLLVLPACSILWLSCIKLHYVCRRSWSGHYCGDADAVEDQGHLRDAYRPGDRSGVLTVPRHGMWCWRRLDGVGLCGDFTHPHCPRWLCPHLRPVRPVRRLRRFRLQHLL